MDRGERRRRTLSYATRARRVWLRAMSSIGFEAHPVGWFAKGKAIGCRCRRHPVGNPKLAGGLCHGSSTCWHPTVVERIEGNRLTRAWLRELRSGDPIDIEL